MGSRTKIRQNLKMDNKGKAGCGCLIGILIIIMIFAGLGFHPVSLKTFAKVFRYGDPVVTADAVFVPRFPEDKNGELYVDAFREYFAGNGKAIYVEEDRIFGVGIESLIAELAKTKGIKEDAIKAIEADGEG